ncbi:hypothetical protein TWF569_000279 [Orbilia oligospora]|uniref:Zn(2)-C6 fungal-type domain-containing protein n=1 Tax=Orbilia oligospora TaxID=2813651 RepID=A0A7C8JDI7_ORBOL|nr:hypothetical protein TWF103_011836 [Orbilia oligospora]KAF3095255.1 hypothetical protein TWF102_007312 [Orbilia oligospora]KAF3116349.1 hypothetical protein TWF706_003997 [Orbilia oligospora]KAF3133553.1 hypothetical protein TWF594_009020 [Orbilia oligospora]KAF3154300.1 hypothetical protein TWF569_000279 [Orbilia oligospora]
MTRGVEDKNICFHCRKDKKKCVRKIEDETSCERCQHYKYDCVPADSYGGIPQPVFKKQPRCTQCRKDHKVCLPYERQPGQSCNRCSEKGLPCIAAAPNSGRSSRPETPNNRMSFEYPNPYQSSSSSMSDNPYHPHRGHPEHGLQRRASLHTYSPHSQYYSPVSSPLTPVGPYYTAEPSRRGDMSQASRTYRPLAPAPHPSSSYSPGTIPPYSSSAAVYPPPFNQVTTPVSPTPSYMSLAMSSPPASPHTSRAVPAGDRIAEIMSINNLLGEGERQRPSSN